MYMYMYDCYQIYIHDMYMYVCYMLMVHIKKTHTSMKATLR